MLNDSVTISPSSPFFLFLFLFLQQADLPEPRDFTDRMQDYVFDPLLMELCKSAGRYMTKVSIGYVVMREWEGGDGVGVMEEEQGVRTGRCGRRED